MSAHGRHPLSTLCTHRPPRLSTSHWVGAIHHKETHMHMLVAIVRQLLAYEQTSRSKTKHPHVRKHPHVKGRKHPHVILHGTCSHTAATHRTLTIVSCLGCTPRSWLSPDAYPWTGVKGVWGCAHARRAMHASPVLALSLSLLVSQEINPLLPRIPQ
jgi:hypothetical protein